MITSNIQSAKFGTEYNKVHHHITMTLSGPSATSSPSHYNDDGALSEEVVEHTRNNEEEGGGGHDEAARPVLLPKVVPPALFRRRSTHVAFVAVAREPVHLHVAVLPPLVHSRDPADVHRSEERRVGKEC